MAWQHYLFLAALAAVALGCLVPNSWLPPLPNDKLLHFGAFAGLAALALPLAHGRLQGLLALGGVLIASWAIECLQQLVPERRFCWRDMAANACGIGAVGAGAFLFGLI
jgi:hypothetical protein